MLKKNPLLIVLGISALFFVVFIAVSIGTVITLTSEKPQKKFFGRANNIGVIEVKGVILDSKKLLEQIEAFAEDPLIKGVIVRINSPGGAVAPSQEVYDALRKLTAKKPVYSSMSSIAASGGYYIACGSKKIFASPGTITGSIGVIMQFADLSKLYSWAKINPYSIKTGRFKDIGSPNREMGPEEKAILQDMVDNVLEQFRKAVATGRNLPLEKVVEVSDGRIFSGEQAKEARLVDELGGMRETVDAMAKELGIPGKPNLVYATKKRHALERIFGELDEDADSESKSNLSGVLGRLAQAASTVLSGAQGSADLRSSFTPTDLIGPLFLMPHALR